MGLFGSNRNNEATALTIPGVGGGISQEQMAMFGQAAQDSGLAGMGLNMMNEMTGGVNTEEVELMYHLMARHPNEVDLFLVQNPAFMSGLAELISTIMKRELYQWFNSPAIAATVDATSAADLGYSTITQENIDTILNNMVNGADANGVVTTPQQRINAADAEAVALINQHKYGMQMGMMGNQMQNQQQMYQQQMMQQQMMNQNQGGLTGALGSFGSSLIRGSLGLPPAPMQQGYGMQGSYGMQGYPQQQGMYGQTPQMQ
ncbi:MAG: hypothetical protein CMA37_00940 [Euryarchaeota archaeon]|mgnify:FL=1|nr:hypothetical protein [Euryarchaeota archaeon]